MSILTKETPYNLYRTIESFYYYDNLNSNISFNIYHDIFDTFDINYINNRIINVFKNNSHYNYKDGIHEYYNKYSLENSKLKAYKSHILLKTNGIKSSLLFNYLMSDNLFVCDFENKDYFWLNEFVR